MLGLPILTLHRARRNGALKRIHFAPVLPRVAFVACGDEIRFIVRATSHERVDVIDYSAEVIEKRSSVTPPPWLMVRERPVMPAFSNQPLHKLQGGRKDYRAVAPPTNPTVAPKNSNLQLV